VAKILPWLKKQKPLFSQGKTLVLKRSVQAGNFSLPPVKGQLYRLAAQNARMFLRSSKAKPFS